MFRKILYVFVFSAIICTSSIPVPAQAQDVAVRSLGRFDGWRENALVGYGIVTGLAGTGDTRRNGVTQQALRNVLSRLGTAVTIDQINGRNVAVVLVMGQLPASANVGDRIDVTVSSIGDARSLAGGTLLMTPLLGPDQRTYALAQGSLLVGGFQFEANQNSQQRNHPTTGRLQGGATVETAVDANILSGGGELGFFLTDPDFGTAQAIADQIQSRFGQGVATVRNADEVRIRYVGEPGGFARFVATIESLRVAPTQIPRVVINERTGTIVAGANVMISPIVISQGDIRITIESRNDASQPAFFSGPANDVSSLVVTNTRLRIEEGGSDAVARFGNTSIADLVQGLSQVHVDTRRIISILQAIKSAGALHAEIIIQ
jgi:flagellar P-ring protein FlgI